MVNKSPYEVRLDVLALAKETLENSQRDKTTRVTNLVALINSDDCKIRTEAKASLSNINMSASISTDDILKEANKLYSFIVTK